MHKQGRLRGLRHFRHSSTLQRSDSRFLLCNFDFGFAAGCQTVTFFRDNGFWRTRHKPSLDK